MVARICLCTAWLFFATQAVAQQNVVIVLDDSGSMGENMRSDRSTQKIGAAKNALRVVLEQLPDDSQVGIVSLNGPYGGWVLPLSQVDRSDIDSVLDRIRATDSRAEHQPILVVMKWRVCGCIPNGRRASFRLPFDCRNNRPVRCPSVLHVGRAQELAATRQITSAPKLRTHRVEDRCSSSVGLLPCGVSLSILHGGV